MNKYQLSTTIKKTSRHLWKHECGETYTRNDIIQLEETEAGKRLCSGCKGSFFFEANFSEVHPTTRKGKGGSTKVQREIMRENTTKMKKRTRGQGPPYSVLPQLFLPNLVPGGNCFVPSGKKVRVEGKLKIIQWSQVPLGASGSSIIKTKDLVLAGISLHISGGEIFFPSQV
ncbi:11347_t:CDS:2 [Gigaspora margarita]|uniref:11347_t:CDS:1 n=1 Tax=Gigaspora margarita TaxID=4874 RepID=A0ABN7VR74_GIGMA|nr:11347_t:CDS:2 [Gigaspora margarita]